MTCPSLDRQRGLLYDVSVGYLHGVLPRSLRRGLPPIGERWGGFGEGSDVDVRERVLGALDQDAWVAAVGPAESRRAHAVPGLPSVAAAAGGRAGRALRRARVAPARPGGLPPVGTRVRERDDSRRESKTPGVRWRSSKLLVDQALQQHLLQVGYVDRLVGALRATSRGGRSLRSRPRRRHGRPRHRLRAGRLPAIGHQRRTFPTSPGSRSSSSTRGNSGGSSIAGTPRRSTSSRRSPT